MSDVKPASDIDISLFSTALDKYEGAPIELSLEIGECRSLIARIESDRAEIERLRELCNIQKRYPTAGGKDEKE